MDYHQRDQQDRQRHNMVSKETIKRRIGQHVVAHDQVFQWLTNDRDRSDHAQNDLCTPEGHLSPWKNVAGESQHHQKEEDHHADQP